MKTIAAFFLFLPFLSMANTFDVTNVSTGQHYKWVGPSLPTVSPPSWGSGFLSVDITAQVTATAADQASRDVISSARDSQLKNCVAALKAGTITAGQRDTCLLQIIREVMMNRLPTADL